MKDDSSFQEFPAYVKHSSGKPRLLAVFIGVFVLAVLAVGALYFIGSQNKDTKTRVSPLPTQMPKSSVVSDADASASGSPKSTTPTPSLERSKLKVAILNGSGTPGAAKATSSHLNSLGYTIATIGNADDFSYKNLTIKIKKSKSEYLPLLKKDVAEKSPDVAITTSIDDDISAEAEVIVGK